MDRDLYGCPDCQWIGERHGLTSCQGKFYCPRCGERLHAPAITEPPRRGAFFVLGLWLVAAVSALIALT
jgi:uncharacterized paraquat-inducible protein A